jgi:hypothetical protein
MHSTNETKLTKSDFEKRDGSSQLGVLADSPKQDQGVVNRGSHDLSNVLDPAILLHS